MKIVIVDDHNLFREGLAAIIKQEPDIEILGLVGTVREAIDTARSMRPDIVLMDYNLPDGTGPEATQKIIQDNHDCKVVFMTMSDNVEDMLTAIRSGAVGYLMKNMAPSKLIATMRSVLRGEGALSRTMTLRLMQEFARTKESASKEDPILGKLTNREKDILLELVDGKSNQEIAQVLVISENTVKYHVHSLLEKLNLKDRKEVAAFAKGHGIKR